MSQNCSINSMIFVLKLILCNFKMSNKDGLEKRIEILEKEVQHLKDALQYLIKNKKKHLD